VPCYDAKDTTEDSIIIVYSSLNFVSIRLHAFTNEHPLLPGRHLKLFRDAVQISTCAWKLNYMYYHIHKSIV
jgi:hypothetical protein